jgi:hypothetical protein
MTIGALALAAVSLVAAQDGAPASATTTIVIVRHAEALADAGREVVELVEVGGDAGLADAVVDALPQLRDAGEGGVGGRRPLGRAGRGNLDLGGGGRQRSGGDEGHGEEAGEGSGADRHRTS